MKKQQEQNLELKNAELEKQLAEKNRALEIEAHFGKSTLPFAVAMHKSRRNCMKLCKPCSRKITALQRL